MSGGPRRVVGIDLGTTNSAVAWLDPSSENASGRPQLFSVQQLVAPGEVRPLRTLPSFLFLPSQQERDGGALALPWDPQPEVVAGAFARDQGALVPARQASSAKSWLSHPAIDRRAHLLPYAAGADASLSPVEVSAQLLAHLRNAWNHRFASHGLLLEEQDIVLTVPASFDDEARELTVEAARAAGLAQLTLLEEPLAAVYSWIAVHSESLAGQLTPGHVLLVCDVGGGTTDFSLIRAATKNGEIEFERIAIGEHLLLGGDNVDVGVAALLERKLAAAAPAAPRLTMTQRLSLQRQASGAKERLLTSDAPDEVVVTVLGSGRAVVGGTTTTVVTRDEVIGVLNDFLPITSVEERPQRQGRRGLRELGLPYASDPAVTRHLAAFLERAGTASGPQAGARDGRGGMIRPDLVLFNGGFFTPPVARDRILDALESWFGFRPGVLTNDSPDAAVAIGAAFYGSVRRAGPAASQHRIRAGSARAYYIGLQNADASGQRTAVCVTPKGTEEGTRLELDRDFTAVANQPAAFSLLSSTQRDDPLGTVITFDAGELHEHAPLVTALRYGQRSRKVTLGLRLVVMFTDIGTLEIWCESKATDHRWRLQFNLRAHERSDAGGLASDGADPASRSEAAERDRSMHQHESTTQSRTQIVVPEEAVAVAEALLHSVFGKPSGSPGPDALIGELERALGHGKHAWPLLTIRRLADVLIQLSDGRLTGSRHEARWLNLAGFCMRPGFGTSLDPWRITELRTVYAAGLAHPRDVECQVQWLILWQRVSAGFTASQQQELANVLVGMLGLGTRKAPRVNPQLFREAWRVLANLERLDRGRRVRLGDELVGKVRREPENAALAWAIGRLGARTPLYGGLNAVVPPDVAERWIALLLTSRVLSRDLVGAIAEIGARTDDPARDIGEDAREATIAGLTRADAHADVVRRLREHVAADDLTATRVFGESLPEGLRLQ